MNSKDGSEENSLNLEKEKKLKMQLGCYEQYQNFGHRQRNVYSFMDRQKHLTM